MHVGGIIKENLLHEHMSLRFNPPEIFRLSVKSLFELWPLGQDRNNGGKGGAKIRKKSNNMKKKCLQNIHWKSYLGVVTITKYDYCHKFWVWHISMSWPCMHIHNSMQSDS